MMSPLLLPLERQAEGEGTKPLAGVDLRRGFAVAFSYPKEGDALLIFLSKFRIHWHMSASFFGQQCNPTYR
jgi:hypothetical protein